MTQMEDIQLDKSHHHHHYSNNIPQLQNLMRRDPSSYKEEFASSLHHFDGLFRLVSLTPGDPSTEFNELITFLCHVSYCYPKESLQLPLQLLSLLKHDFFILHPATRFSIVTNLILLKHRNQIHDLPELYSVFFELLACHDKSLRNTIYGFLLNDIKTMNTPNSNEKLNRVLQAFLVKYWDTKASIPGKGTASELMAKLCLRLTIELYYCGIWSDARTVNYIALAALSPHASICRAALHFFTGGRPEDNDDTEESEDDEDDNNNTNDSTAPNTPKMTRGTQDSGGISSTAIDKLKHSMRVSGTTKGALKKIKRAAASVKKLERKSSGKLGTDRKVAPLLSLHDPQGFAEKLFSKLKTSNENFDLRLCFMNVISRLISYHSLTLLSFYSYLTKYLRPSQPSITNILLYAAQSVHDTVPVDLLQETLLSPLLQYFIADYCVPEVITVGINALREMCKRNLHILAPQEIELAIEKAPLVGRKRKAKEGTSASSCSSTIAYLIAFKSYKNKGVVMAARSLLALYREKMPSYLPKKERGKTASIKLQDKTLNTTAKEALSGIEEDAISQSMNDSMASDQEDEEDASLSDSDIISYHSDSNSNSNSESESELGSHQENESNAETCELFDYKSLAKTSASVETEFIHMNNIVSFSKQKSSYEERLASIKAGRDDRDKYKRQSKKLASGGSKSNTEKNKKKNFMMMKHKRSGIFSKDKKSIPSKVSKKAQRGKVRK